MYDSGEQCVSAEASIILFAFVQGLNTRFRGSVLQACCASRSYEVRGVHLQRGYLEIVRLLVPPFASEVSDS